LEVYLKGKSERQKKELTLEKRILLLGVGTEKNPIKLVPENTHRSLLKKFSTAPALDKTELHKLKEDYINAQFILNALSNPYLLHQELKLIFYFYQRLWSSAWMNF
jgi:hypothetical protein